MKKIILLSSALLFAGLAGVFSACTKGTGGGQKGDGFTLEFRVSEVTKNSAQISVYPSDVNTDYYWSVIDKQEYDEMGADAVKKRDIDRFVQTSTVNKMPLADVISQETSRGNANKTISDLYANTTFVVYGYSLAGDGSTGPISTYTFGTDQTGVLPEAALDIMATASSMTEIDLEVVPYDMEVLYAVDYMTDDEYKAYGGDDEGVLAYFWDYIDYSVAQYQSQGYSDADRVSVIKSGWKRGVYAYKRQYLIPDTKYWFYAVQLDENCEFVGLKAVPASTYARDFVDCTFTVTATNVTQQGAVISFIPSDKKQKYVAGVVTASSYQSIGGGTDESFMNAYVRQYSSVLADETVMGDRITGSNAPVLYGLIPGVEYMAFAFAYENGAWVSTLGKANFTTVGVIAEKDLTFDIEIAELTSTAVAGYFHVNDALVYCHFGAVPKSYVDAAGATTDEEIVKAGFNYTIQLWLDYMNRTDPDPDHDYTWNEVLDARKAINPSVEKRYTYYSTTMVPDTEYYFWAGSFDLTTTSPEATRLISQPFLKPFRTLQYQESSAVATPVLHPKYFRLYGSNADLADPVSLGGPADVGTDLVGFICESVTASNADKYYVGFFKGDYTDQTEYPNYFIASNAERSGNLNLCSDGKKRMVNLSYGKWTVVAVGVGADGKYGVPYRQLFDFTAEGCSPVSEFPSDVWHAAQRPSAAAPKWNGVALKYSEMTPSGNFNYMSNFETSNRPAAQNGAGMLRTLSPQNNFNGVFNR